MDPEPLWSISIENLSRSSTRIVPFSANSHAGYSLPGGNRENGASIMIPRNGQSVATYETCSSSGEYGGKVPHTNPHTLPASSNTGPPLMPPSNLAFT